MSRKLLDKARRRLSAETGCSSNPWGGRLSVALVYPNTYRQAMSNLGFLSVYQQLNARNDTLCERFFLPDAEDLAEHRKTGYPLFSLESGTVLNEFDVVAFSISFENDYLNLPVIFELGRLPLLASDRGDRCALVLCGGVCAFLNPEPLAQIMDLFAVGEAEPILPPLVDALHERPDSRQALLRSLATLPGIYVPSLYKVEYGEDGTIAAIEAEEGAPARVARQWLVDLHEVSTRSFILTEDTEFSDMALTEISRGCSRGCRFCAAGYLYLPPRERRMESLSADIDEGLCQRKKIGLVGAAVSDHSDIGALNSYILDHGGHVSVASLRLDALQAQEIRALKASGHRTVALAPEAGSQRLRDLINKGIDTDQILRATALLAEEGILNLKLYFLIGLPTETEEDMRELLDLVRQIREGWLARQKEHGRLGTISLSVNPFIPKPFTPLQWAGMPGEKEFKTKIKYLRSGIGRLPNTEIRFESLRSAFLQALLSRGDRRTGALLPHLAQGLNLAAACREEGLDPSFYIHRERREDEIFPWEVLDSGVSRGYLWREYRQALAGLLTPRCAPGCRRCGVC
jgi:radical SAM superfamily enzyme YgiQ (UPF0313 family)